MTDKVTTFIESGNYGNGKFTMQHVGVLGAASLVGSCLIPMLTNSGCHVSAFSRKVIDRSNSNVSWRQLQLANSPHLPSSEKPIAHWLCLLPIWHLPPYLTLLEAYGVQRLVALSSTSRFTKNNSSDPEEQILAQRIAESEACVVNWAEKHGIEWVILRPTLIYGLGKDKNISEIARFVRRFGFFPLFGKAMGLRQPIHAQDVANACREALQETACTNRFFNISGGETLTYRDMVTRVFIAMGRHPRLLPVPLSVFRVAVAFLRYLPRYKGWSAAMAERMNVDMVFDSSEAAQDLGFVPRKFLLSRADFSEYGDRFNKQE
jgi:uncharacterized protein YbjT (DUF2867 family)